MDREGYGYGDHQSLIERLQGDLRTLGPSGIERIANGFRHSDHEHFHKLEREALQAIEGARGVEWEELKAQIHHLTDGGGSLESWKAEHGDNGHLAEAAVLGAALGILALPDLSRAHYLGVVTPLGEALPWVKEITPDGRVVLAPDPE